MVTQYQHMEVVIQTQHHEVEPVVAVVEGVANNNNASTHTRFHKWIIFFTSSIKRIRTALINHSLMMNCFTNYG